MTCCQRHLASLFPCVHMLSKPTASSTTILFMSSGCIDDVLGGCGFINGQQVSVDDDNSHGTHVAGSIGATKNGAGVLGVAQKVSLMSCKFLDADGNGFNSDAIACINYCAANFKRMGQKVPIYSNSWGCLNCYDPTVYNAIANTAGQLLHRKPEFTLSPSSQYAHNPSCLSV